MDISTAIVTGSTILGIAILILKFTAPKTETKWDDSVLDVIEGACKQLGISPEELAQKSIGDLKEKIKKENDKKK